LPTLTHGARRKLPLRELKHMRRRSRRRASRISDASSRSAAVAGAPWPSAILNSLGGLTTVKRDGKDYRVEGVTCPLSVAVSARPEVCEAVRTMLSESTGTEVIECCKRGERNQCTFVVTGTP